MTMLTSATWPVRSSQSPSGAANPAALCDVCCSAGSDAFERCGACLPSPPALEGLCSAGHMLGPASRPSALPLELLRTLHKMRLWPWLWLLLVLLVLLVLLLLVGLLGLLLLLVGLLLLLALLTWLQIVTLLLAQLRSADLAR